MTLSKLFPLTQGARLFMRLCCIIATAIPFSACEYNDDLLTAAKAQEEFSFTLEDLEDYQTWTVMGYKERTDIGSFRTIYINKPEEAMREDGAYSTGTIIVKESRDFNDRNQVVRYQIMSKRGGTYNIEGNGWEWANTFSGDLTLLERGDNGVLFNGSGCFSCHAGYNDLVIKDYD